MSKIFEFGRSFPSDSLRAELSSGDDDSSPGCTLTLALLGWNLRISLPQIIKPYSVRHIAGWDAATVARMGRNWYDEKFQCRYGFYIYEGHHLYVSLGAQTHDSSTTKSWSCFLPWKEWRFVRHTYYNLEAQVFWEQIAGDIKGIPKFEDQYAAEQLCPKVRFKLRDYDGAKIIATTVIEEREWLKGDKWCKWLSLFYKPMVRRSLKIDFSAETGPEKGSWKGGTTGTSINMLPGELHTSAMRRFCDKEHPARHSQKFRMQFVSRIT
jgi:hypothetical protein